MKSGDSQNDVAERVRAEKLLVDELIEIVLGWDLIFQKSRVMCEPSKIEHVRTKEIGKKLFFLGGKDLLLCVYAEIDDLTPCAKMLEPIWKGIGG